MRLNEGQNFGVHGNGALTALARTDGTHGFILPFPFDNMMRI